MKNLLLLAALAVALAAVGCKRPASTESTGKQLDRAQSSAGAAAREIRDYTFAQKAEFVARMQARLTELNRTLDEVAAKLARSSDGAKAEHAPQLAALREPVAQLDRQLTAVAGATETTWSAIKADAEKAFDAAMDGVARSRRWLGDHIAP